MFLPVTPLATWLPLEGVNPEVVLRKTPYVTPEVGDAVQLRPIAELEVAVAARFEGGCGGGVCGCPGRGEAGRVAPR